VKPDTIAKSLAIGNPADGPYALDLARRTDGSIDAVSDDEIRDGIRLLAQTTGIFTETAGGVTTAVLRKLAERGDLGADDRVVLVITGDGLKTLDAVRDTFESHEIEPSIEAFEQVLARDAVGAVKSVVPMAVTVKIPTQLRSVTGGDSETAVDGATTVGDVLDGLYERYDGLRDRIAEDGDLRRFVNVYVGGEDIRFLEGLDTPVEDGDEVTILPAVAGGS
jgi:MoaD family protein